MIKSMTGFASLTREDEALTVSVTARSVNHRYLDLQVHLPPGLLRLEPMVREQAQRRLARGRVEIRVAVRHRERPALDVEVNEPLLAALLELADRPDVREATRGRLVTEDTCRDAGSDPGDVAHAVRQLARQRDRWTVGELLGFPQVVTVAERAADPAADAMADVVVTGAVGEALGELDRMRTSEGGHLRADLDERLVALGRLIERIEREAGAGAEALGQRLTARLAEIGPDVHADQAALAQEVVRFVARSDIHEEITRLRAHVSHWAALADAPEPCGRKLDFLLQEMNREVNTIGSKADGHETSGLVVAAKAELEKLREQAQNVE